MAKEDFKTIYKTDFNSQSALFNIHFPEEIAEITRCMKAVSLNQSEAIEIAYAWFDVNIPAFEKFFENQDEIEKDLELCGALIREWKMDHKKQFPVRIQLLLKSIYRKFWRAYNASGAGIKGSVYVPFDTRVKNALRNL